MGITVPSTYTELCQGDSFYNQHIHEWKFFNLAYDGGRDFVHHVIRKNPLESDANYTERRREGYYFNYPATIVGLYAFALMEQEPKSEYGSLSTDELWQIFIKNSDLFGTDLKDFIDNAQIFASINGVCGVLVNKPEIPAGKNRQYEIDNNITPYLTVYEPSRILKTEFERNPSNHKIELTYLKLLDIDERVQIWTKDEILVLKRDTSTDEAKKADSFTIVFSGKNNIGEIPFILMKNLYNPKSLKTGLSDLREIAPIAASVIRNCSIAEEALKNAGFPMMRKPMLEEGQDDPDETGPTAILEFDPNHGEAGKPDWLKPEVREAIISVLEWIDRKVDEIYRIAYLSGMHQQAKGSQVRSGVALRYELKQLTSILTKKIKGLVELETGIIRFFLKWQNQYEKMSEVSISRPIEFTMDELVDNIDLLKSSLEYISSDEYNMQAQKRIIQLLLPGLPKTVLNDINNEIYSTRKEYLAIAMAGTTDRNFGVVQAENRNAIELAKMNLDASKILKSNSNADGSVLKNPNNFNKGKNSSNISKAVEGKNS